MAPRRKQVTYSQRPNHAARSAHARGEREFRTYDTSYIRPKRSKVPAVIAAVVAVVVIGLLVWAIFTLVNGCSSGEVELLPEGEETTIVIADGADAKTIGEQLAEARLIESASAFTSRVNDLGVASQLKPGTYTLTGGTELDDIVRTIEGGPDQGVGLTIPEGYTLSQIAQRVADYTDNRVTADDFTAAASDASVYASSYPFLVDAGTASLEGFLFPKTYTVADDATADSLIRQMLDQFQTETADIDWSYPQSQGLSLYQAVDLASIVEKESSDDQQVRSQVAAVFYNRLNTMGEPSYGYLQSDATTAYEVGHDPSGDEVHADTPYSTYSNQGLPPTPICSPSLSSLQAVCSPDQDSLGRYFFFYFEPDENGDMRYHFSETYTDHMNSFS